MALYNTFQAGPVRVQQAPSTKATQFYTAAYAPQMAGLDLKGTQLQNSLGQFYAASDLAASQVKQGGQFIDADYGLGMDKIANQRAGIGIDTDYQNKLAQFAQQLLGVNQADLTNQSQTATRNTQSQAIANGALQAKNTVANLADIVTQRDLGMQKLQIGYGQTQAGITRALDLNKNQLAGLDIMAKEYGLSRDKALAGINQGLAKLNLDKVIGAQDLFDAMQSNDIQRQQLANQIMMEAMQGYRSGYFGYDRQSSPSTYSGTPKGTSSTRKIPSSIPKNSWVYGQLNG